MSLYWNNVLLKRFSNISKNRFKYKINTNLGRIYFYLEKEKDSEEVKFSGKIVFFPKRKI